MRGGARTRGRNGQSREGAEAEPPARRSGDLRPRDNHTEQTAAISDRPDSSLLGTHARSYFYPRTLLGPPIGAALVRSAPQCARTHAHTQKERKKKEEETTRRSPSAPKAAEKKSGVRRYQRRPRLSAESGCDTGREEERRKRTCARTMAMGISAGAAVGVVPRTGAAGAGRSRPPSKAGGSAANKKRKTPAEPSEPSTPEADALAQLDAAIAQRREAFAAQEARVPEMRAAAAVLREQAAALSTCRATMRRAQSAGREADAIDASIARIESARERHAFDARADRYMSLARANAEREAAVGRNKRPCHAAPGTAVETADVAADAAAAAATTTTISNVALLREYRAEFEEQAPPMHIVQHDACPTCAVPLLLSVNGALLTCPECRAGYPYMDATTASMAYGDEVEFLSNNPKKAHHFEDRLKMFQGKGSKKVTKHVLDSVMEWHAAQGITSIDDITTLTVRQALKANAFKDHYDFEMYIWCCITGKPAPTLGPTKENYCRQMFMRIQAPYAKWKARIDPTRINFLSYGYVLYKFFQLLDWTEYLPYFSLLKGRDKLEKQEAIWKGICKDVEWPFIPAPAGPPPAPRASTSRSVASPATKASSSSSVGGAATVPMPTAAATLPVPRHVRAPSILAKAVAAARASRSVPAP
ncbi:Poxvirus Late Transcription Factor VLTF3 like protein [Pandoravirus salinus]|uniref:Poxvirus Late Transcription Factor VLTF3 like protein n=1 Tax=Pandoravirus salinus TaxID=1349410 RepID=S4VU59_9VIRU|nr:Poxvirus Late Transcription Factor VLTF3 like protein [Pandoravirus salinus]AGO83883.2 Poxvirus Late Transcription Factor VLTF3 like protein [Pandoravirus salinus]